MTQNTEVYYPNKGRLVNKISTTPEFPLGPNAINQTSYDTTPIERSTVVLQPQAPSQKGWIKNQKPSLSWACKTRDYSFLAYKTEILFYQFWLETFAPFWST
jgi:hypothetical protein